MLNFAGKRVYLACGKTDMRKSINGLAAIVEGSFALDPFDGAVFVFCNRSRDRVKILELFRSRNNSSNSAVRHIPMITGILHPSVKCRKKYRNKYRRLKSIQFSDDIIVGLP